MIGQNLLLGSKTLSYSTFERYSATLILLSNGLTKPEISSIGIYEVFIELIWHGFKPGLPQKADHVRGAVLFATDPVKDKR
jgi:hypothetical protein